MIAQENPSTRCWFAASTRAHDKKLHVKVARAIVQLTFSNLIIDKVILHDMTARTAARFARAPLPSASAQFSARSRRTSLALDDLTRASELNSPPDERAWRAHSRPGICPHAVGSPATSPNTLDSAD